MSGLWEAVVTVSNVVPPAAWFFGAVALIVWVGIDVLRAWSSFDNDPPEVS